MESDSLDDRLKCHSSCFSSMVELIPVKFYLTKDPEMDETLASSKYWVNKKQTKAPKQSVKEATKRAKRIKLDPDSHKTVLEQQKDAQDSEETVSVEGSNTAPNKIVKTVRSTELSNLRERLNTKINSLRGKRKTRDDEPEKFALKKQKLIEKRKRVKEARQKKKKQLVSSANVTKESTQKEERPSIKDESGKIVFSKFDFSANSEKSQKRKDYKRLLAKAEATEKKLEELKKNDQKRGQELQEKLQWRKAIDLAKGTKVKDDPKLIKKTLKRLEKKKTKSRKQWTERAEQEQQQKDKKQELRKKHVQERIELIKAKKNRKKIKKGKRTPGF